ncbi:hypothetical protein U0070_005829, partial [Myodes glareolus]
NNFKMTTPNKTPPGADPKQLERTATVREIGSQAVWSLSSLFDCHHDHGKEGELFSGHHLSRGFGVDQLRDDNLETYWQSDGSQPHLVNIQFRRKTTVKTLCIYADYKSDESYTPSKISVRVGNHFHNLQEIRPCLSTCHAVNVMDGTKLDQLELVEPSGWIHVPLTDNHKKPTRTFMIQIAVLANHQNGRDTHMRQIKIYTPVEESSIGKFPRCTTIDFMMYRSIRLLGAVSGSNQENQKPENGGSLKKTGDTCPAVFTATLFTMHVGTWNYESKPSSDFDNDSWTLGIADSLVWEGLNQYSFFMCKSDDFAFSTMEQRIRVAQVTKAGPSGRGANITFVVKTRLKVQSQHKVYLLVSPGLLRVTKMEFDNVHPQGACETAPQVPQMTGVSPGAAPPTQLSNASAAGYPPPTAPLLLLWKTENLRAVDSSRVWDAHLWKKEFTSTLVASGPPKSSPFSSFHVTSPTLKLRTEKMGGVDLLVPHSMQDVLQEEEGAKKERKRSGLWSSTALDCRSINVPSLWARVMLMVCRPTEDERLSVKTRMSRNGDSKAGARGKVNIAVTEESRSSWGHSAGARKSQLDSEEL